MPSPDCPQRLYKYFAPDRVSVLTSGLLRYSPLGAFNDPFEGRPEVTSIAADKDVKQTLQTILHEEAERAYQLLVPHVQAAYSYSRFLELVESSARAKQPAFQEQFRAITPIATRFLQRKFDEYLGALCLSEVPDSLLMWSHYAASHAGFVVEFNAHHPYFHERKSPEDEFRHLRRVMYCETRPSASLSELSVIEMFLVKSGHWAYENEWRILRALPEADKVEPSDPFPIHLFQFPPEIVTAVILGTRASSDTVVAVRNGLQSNQGYKSVRLKRAAPDPAHFVLRIRDE